MRAKFLVPAPSVILLVLLGVTDAAGQSSGSGKGSPSLPDVEGEILKQIREAYKAPFEVHEDVLKELRKSYQQPTPEREAEIFKELRRLYQLSPEREMSILREIRRAYEQPSLEQEARIFQEIDRAERLPLGAVPATVQVSQAEKLFAKLDLNGNGVLSSNEMPDAMRAERGRWDANGDGFLDRNEYWAYYQGRLQSISEQVAAGEIELKSTKKIDAILSPAPAVEAEARPTVYRAGRLPAGLPDWFVRLDTDRDGQIGLYEWQKGGRPIKEFASIDPNNDGFITAEELLRHLTQPSANGPDGSPKKPGKKVSKSGK